MRSPTSRILPLIFLSWYVQSLLVASGADDGRLVGLLEQVHCVLLSLRGSVTVKRLRSWGAMVEVVWQNLLNYRAHMHLSLSNDL